MNSRLAALLFLAIFFAAAVSGCLGGKESQENASPEARFSTAPGGTPTSIAFDGGESTDPDGDALQYWWNFGDGSQPIEGKRVEHQYLVTDTTFMASLVVRDPKGAAGSTFQPIKLGGGVNVAGEVHLADVNRWVKPGREVVLDASASDDHDGDSLSAEWIFGPRVTASETAKAPANACATASTNPYVFSTACLSQNQGFNVTFGQSGTYDYHCHPHPWMKARLIVDPAADIEGSHEVQIENFAFSDQEVRVKPGTRVRFVNRDPTAHTATLEYFAPGINRTDGTVLRVTPEVGDYVARVFLNDDKGGLVSVTYGIRVNSDAPASPERRTYKKESPVPQRPEDPAVENWNNFTHRSRVEATLENWTDPGGLDNVRVNITLATVDDGGRVQVIDGCYGRPLTGEADKLRFACTVEGGNYKIRVKVEKGTAAMWDAIVLLSPYASPGFGDSSGGEHHH